MLLDTKKEQELYITICLGESPGLLLCSVKESPGPTKLSLSIILIKKLIRKYQNSLTVYILIRMMIVPMPMMIKKFGLSGKKDMAGPVPLTWMVKFLGSFKPKSKLTKGFIHIHMTKSSRFESISFPRKAHLLPKKGFTPFGWMVMAGIIHKMSKGISRFPVSYTHLTLPTIY